MVDIWMLRAISVHALTLHLIYQDVMVYSGPQEAALPPESTLAQEE